MDNISPAINTNVSTANMNPVEKTDDISQIENSTPRMTQNHIDPSLERRVLRKLDFNMMPLIFALCKITVRLVDSD